MNDIQNSYKKSIVSIQIFCLFIGVALQSQEAVNGFPITVRELILNGFAQGNAYDLRPLCGGKPEVRAPNIRIAVRVPHLLILVSNDRTYTLDQQNKLPTKRCHV